MNAATPTRWDPSDKPALTLPCHRIIIDVFGLRRTGLRTNTNWITEPNLIRGLTAI